MLKPKTKKKEQKVFQKWPFGSGCYEVTCVTNDCLFENKNGSTLKSGGYAIKTF